MAERNKASPAWYEEFVANVERFAAALPAHVERRFERHGEYFLLDVIPPTHRHRRLTLEGSLTEFDYSLGQLWTERLEPSADLSARLLATLEAVRRGGVKEVRDHRTGVIYHIYRVRTHGFSEFMQDSQYSIWHWLRLKIRNVEIRSLPSLDQTQINA